MTPRSLPARRHFSHPAQSKTDPDLFFNPKNAIKLLKKLRMSKIFFSIP
jgi:hypothetical protein